MMPVALVFNNAFSDSRPEFAAVALGVAAGVNSEVPPVCLYCFASRIYPILLVTVWISMKHPLVVVGGVAGASSILFSAVRFIVVI